MPLSTGFSPSEFLNGRQIRTKIDTLLPSPAHTAQGKQAEEATKSQQSERQLPVTKWRLRTRSAIHAMPYTLAWTTTRSRS